jgi:hypothetical protein
LGKFGKELFAIGRRRNFHRQIEDGGKTDGARDTTLKILRQFPFMRAIVVRRHRRCFAATMGLGLGR